MPSEFDLIRDYFSAATAARDDVLLGIGDDCALLQAPAGQAIASSTDTLVEGRHFLAGTDPEALGHKCLAVNLSDLAAMGAEPAWVSLALTLPSADEDWLRGFMQGFSALAGVYGVQLVGGDTTRGPLSITVQVQGLLDPVQALRRSGGQDGEQLFVSGRIGAAALALQQQFAGLDTDEILQRRLDRPTPRVELGLLLREYASAAIDISDGLLADLGHVCRASDLGARVLLADLPLSEPVAAACADGDWHLPLSGGDDYELLFSVRPERVTAMQAACSAAGHEITRIGSLREGTGIILSHPDGHESLEGPDGFDHFKA